MMSLNIVVSLIVIAATSASSSASKGKKPNIILILMDDLGYSELGYLGGDIPTSNIDTLAQKGIRLNYHYAENICSATRSALLTGRYAWKTQLDDVIGLPSTQGTDTSFDLISDILLNKGYDTLFVGKWHIGSSTPAQLPHSRGFKQSLYFTSGFTDYFEHNICLGWNMAASTGLAQNEVDPDTLTQLNDKLPNGFCGYDLWFDDHKSYINYDANNDYVEDIFAERIETFLDSQSEDSDPFFIYWSMPTPHTPIMNPPQISAECDLLIGETRRQQCNMIFYADLLIGELITQLKRIKVYKNTLLFFVSDNGAQPALPVPDIGESAGQPLPFRGAKGNVFEGGIRTPAFIFGDYLKKMHHTKINCDYNNLVYVSDFYPMIAELAGVSLMNDEIDGIALWRDIEKECNFKLHSKKLESSEIEKRNEIISFRYNADTAMFYRAYVLTNEYKFLVNPNFFGNPVFTFDFLQYWVNYDTTVFLEPNDEYYNLYNDFDKNHFNQNLFYSKCFEDDNINIAPYIDENENKIYLFDIRKDNIEACNVALDNMGIVQELFDILKEKVGLYRGSGGIYGEKGGYLAMKDSYDCDEETMFYVTWADDSSYMDIIQDWNTVLLSFIDKVESCQ